MMIKTLLSLALLFSQTVIASDFSQLFEQLSPSVVVLKTFSKVPAKDVDKGMVSQSSLGSGVVINSSGDILTAAHVVHTVDAIHVEFTNGNKVLGEVVASDPGSDLALIRLKNAPDNLSVATIGDSDSARIGQQVLVIGAPLGFEQSLSVGYISSRRQSDELKGLFKRGEFIQIDAAVNKGNSGGPVFNSAGEVIGIISHIQSLSGGSDGLGFAVTSNSANAFINDRGNVWSGMEAIPMTPALARIMHYPFDYGVLVQNISSKSPAAQAGIRGGEFRAQIGDVEILLGGDVIVSIESISAKDEKSFEQIMEKLQSKKPGEPIKVQVYRKGTTVDVFVKKPG